MEIRPAKSDTDRREEGRRIAVAGVLLSLLLGTIKLVAGLLGHSFALVADAAESFTDILGSAVVWGGLRIAGRPITDEHPYGYGKAEALSGMVVAVLVIVAGVAIAVQSVHGILTPHLAPRAFTLAVLVVVVITKETMFQIARRAAKKSGSPAVEADAWHHRSDALTSAAAFVGISVALIGGKGWERADDIAAFVAALVIIASGVRLIIAPVRQLLDATDITIASEAITAATAVPGVRHVQKAMARTSGSDAWVDMHVWVDGSMNVRDAHSLAHAVKEAVRAKLPRVRDVLVHVEPAAEKPAAQT